MFLHKQAAACDAGGLEALNAHVRVFLDENNNESWDSGELEVAPPSNPMVIVNSPLQRSVR